MGIVLVIVGIVAVWLLWRILQVQRVRAQVEVANVVVQRTESALSAFAQRMGTEAQAMREGRFIEYCEEAARAFGMSDDDMKNGLLASKAARHALVMESLERGKQCRFLDEMDYDEVAPQAHYPGPMPGSELMCSDVCSATEELTYMPPDAKTCPFCGAPTKPLHPPELVEKLLATWRQEDAAWQLWKKRAPQAAAKDEADELASRAADEAEERREFEAALVAFKSGVHK
jgi:hypothetical protein